MLIKIAGRIIQTTPLHEVTLSLSNQRRNMHPPLRTNPNRSSKTVGLLVMGCIASNTFRQQRRLAFPSQYREVLQSCRQPRTSIHNPLLEPSEHSSTMQDNRHRTSPTRLQAPRALQDPNPCICALVVCILHLGRHSRLVDCIGREALTFHHA